MAGEINFGILDASIPARVANSFQEGLDMRRKNALAELAYSQAMQQVDDDKAMRSYYQQAGGDTNQLIKLAMGGGQYKQAMDLQKSMLEQEAKRATIRKDTASAGKSELDAQMQRLNRTSQLITSAVDQPSYERAIALASQEFGPESVAKLPAQYDPALVKQLGEATRTAQERMQEQLQRQQMGVTMRGQDMSADTARRGQDITIRGQNMTDARAKEGLALQRESARNQIVETPDGVMLVDKGTGQAKPAMAGGVPLPGKQPEAVKKELMSINQQRSIIDGALRAVDATPTAFSFGRGMAGKLPLGESVAGRMESPEQTQARSYVFNNVSRVINERAGAAQSAQELARLNTFLPADTDSPQQIKNKLAAFKTYLDDLEAGTKGPQVAKPATGPNIDALLKKYGG